MSTPSQDGSERIDATVSDGPAELAARIVEAINSRDRDRLAELLDEASEVVTGRTTHRGPEQIVAWSRKEYDHLVRRYSIDEYRTRGGAVLALGSVEYVWIEDGSVGDSSPIALEFRMDGKRLSRLSLRDDTAAALADFIRI